jgi:hypothetical protein
VATDGIVQCLLQHGLQRGGWCYLKECDRVCVSCTDLERLRVMKGCVGGEAWQRHSRAGLGAPRCTNALNAMELQQTVKECTTRNVPVGRFLSVSPGVT